ANYGMINGNFELDFNDGEIRYKTSIDVDGDKLSFALIKNLVYANVIMMDEYLPGIINVIESDISPELAINPIEQNQEINQSSDEIEQLPLIIAVDEQKEDIKTQNRNPYILAILTPEEIAQFHHALQVMPPYQHKQTDAILAKLKKELISRLGELGETIFIQANIFFKEITISAKNIKLIQRYSGIAGRIQSLLEKLQNLSQKDDELPINAPDLKAISDLKTLFNSVEQRLQELPSDALIGNKEVELLVEIEDLRANLVRREKLL
ncbi:YbjN domain-containing protein, partial [Anabaena sp. UHCC 0253]|uniref:YbjN domain-containing protein n=1 Tax=Anabaena sp. UHCC 0253 TaxID=2590019 RepID=UPI001C2B7F11